MDAALRRTGPGELRERKQQGRPQMWRLQVVIIGMAEFEPLFSKAVDGVELRGALARQECAHLVIC
jgi:hypothetical protein